MGSAFGAAVGAAVLISPYEGYWNTLGAAVLILNVLLLLGFEFFIRTEGET